MMFGKKFVVNVLFLGVVFPALLLAGQGKLSKEFTLVVADTYDDLAILLPKLENVYADGFAPLRAREENRSVEETRRELVGRWKTRSAQILARAKEDKVFAHVIKNKNDDKIVAFAIMFATSKLNKLYLHYIAIHPSAQGQKLGRFLIFYIFEKYLLVNKVILNTSAKNKKAQGFYEHIGFKLDYKDLGKVHYKLKRV